VNEYLALFQFHPTPIYDNLSELTLTPIGVAHTPYETTNDAPHQGFADDIEAEIEVFEDYTQFLSSSVTVS
jgi:tRNA (Thr-GGU) A37 N-methylase